MEAATGIELEKDGFANHPSDNITPEKSIAIKINHLSRPVDRFASNYPFKCALRPDENREIETESYRRNTCCDIAMVRASCRKIS